MGAPVLKNPHQGSPRKLPGNLVLHGPPEAQARFGHLNDRVDVIEHQLSLDAPPEPAAPGFAVTGTADPSSLETAFGQALRLQACAPNAKA